MPPAAILAALIPLVIKVIDHLEPADAEELRRKLNEAIDRRRAAVARNEALDAPRDNDDPQD